MEAHRAAAQPSSQMIAPWDGEVVAAQTQSVECSELRSPEEPHGAAAGDQDEEMIALSQCSDASDMQEGEALVRGRVLPQFVSDELRAGPWTVTAAVGDWGGRSSRDPRPPLWGPQSLRTAAFSARSLWCCPRPRRARVYMVQRDDEGVGRIPKHAYGKE